ncbi:MAG: tetratricopeptide repeat protein, partial [Methanophagales archaeon]|nr:tetratricopeptide repeat protein [Methanophagales archaeon]
AEAWNNKGVALSKLRRYEEAIECFNRALKINQNDAEAWNNKGNVLDELGKYEEAVELKGKAVFLLCLEGRTDIAFDIFKEVYDKRLNIPICYECGIALASLLCLRNKVYDEIVADCNRNKDNICSSAKIVLKYLIDGETEGEIEVRDEKDAAFKVLLGKLTEEE